MMESIVQTAIAIVSVDANDIPIVPIFIGPAFDDEISIFTGPAIIDDNEIITTLY